MTAANSQNAKTQQTARRVFIGLSPYAVQCSNGAQVYAIGAIGYEHRAKVAFVPYEGQSSRLSRLRTLGRTEAAATPGERNR